MKYLYLVTLLMASATTNAAPLNLVSGPLNSGQIFVPCEFDGNQQDCVIDTGSPRTFIKKDSFSLSYPSKGVVEHGGASGAKVKCDLIEIKKFSLNPDFDLSKMTTARCPIEDDSDIPISESVIGLNVFDQEIIHFNFRSNNLSSAKEIPKDLTKNSIQKEPRGHFSIKMDSAGIKTYGVWDTGAGLTSIDEEFVKNHPDNFEYIQDIWGSDGIGNPILMKLYKAQELIVGGKHFQGIHVIAFDFSPLRPYFNRNIDFIIGYNLIIEANWYFDFSSYHWALK